MVTWLMTSRDLERSKSRPHYLYGPISPKKLEMEVWFQRTTNRKWRVSSGMVTWPSTSRHVTLQVLNAGFNILMLCLFIVSKWFCKLGFVTVVCIFCRIFCVFFCFYSSLYLSIHLFLAYLSAPLFSTPCLEKNCAKLFLSTLRQYFPPTAKIFGTKTANRHSVQSTC